MAEAAENKRFKVVSPPSKESPTESCPAEKAERMLPQPFQSIDFMNAIGVCGLCQKSRQLGAIFGDPGSGKSIAVNAFAQRAEDVVLFTARVEMSPKDILNELAKSIGIIVSGTRYERVSAIIEELQNHPRMLIVDEGENLITYTTLKMEIFREIFDRANVAMVLCGDLRLESFLIKGPTLRENLSRFYSRIRYSIRLTGLTSAEAKVMIGQLTDVSPAAQSELLTYVSSTKHGSIRVLNHLTEICRSLAEMKNEQEISRDTVKEAAKFLLVRR